MLPNPTMSGLHLFGPITIYPFGVLVASGVMAGIQIIYRRSRELGLPDEKVNGAINWVLIPGFIGAHVFEVLFYQAHRLETEGFITLLKVWDGISSYGGFLGALLGFLYYSRVKLKQDTLFYVDLLIQGITVGWIFGRAGCTIAFDHPGTLSNFALAFSYPGGARHNLGFYEFLYTLFVLFPAILLVHKYKLKAGYQAVVICMLYAPARFFLDLFRAEDISGADTRYLGLTFAHYCSILLFIFSVYLLYRLKYKSSPAGGSPRRKRSSHSK